MQIIAFIFAAIALLLFLATAAEVPKRWVSVALGLAFLSAAWMVQVIVLTGGHVKIN